jgi:DNA-binding response OmpR family regulator
VTDILVVEDDRSTMRFIELNLTAEGYRLRAAFDANEALAALEETPPDLVILDLNLPSRSGWEVLGILKAEPRWRRIPVAILTAAAAPEEERRARELHVADYIIKPLSADDFLARVAALVARGDDA